MVKVRQLSPHESYMAFIADVRRGMLGNSIQLTGQEHVIALWTDRYDVLDIAPDIPELDADFFDLDFDHSKTTAISKQEVLCRKQPSSVSVLDAWFKFQYWAGICALSVTHIQKMWSKVRVNSKLQSFVRTISRFI